MRNYNFTALWNRDPDSIGEEERTSFLQMFDRLFFNTTYEKSGRKKRSVNLTEVEEPVRQDSPFEPQELEEMVEGEEGEYWGEEENFPLFFTREYALEHYPYLVEGAASDEVFFFFEELALKEMGVDVFNLALNPQEIYILSQMKPYVHYLPEPMLRETCEMTPPVSTGQRVVEAIASLFPPLAIGILLRDVFAPIRQEELCITEVLNMEDIINLTMDFLVEDWLENEGDSDFVDYLDSMGIHQHQSHAHPAGERKKREARRFFNAARGPTIIQPKYIRRLLTTPRPSGKNKKKQKVVPQQPTRERRSPAGPLSMLRSDLERKRYCTLLRRRRWSTRAMSRKCDAFLAIFGTPLSLEKAKHSTRVKRGYGGISPSKPCTRPTTSGGTRSGLNWRLRQQGSRTPSPDRPARNNFVMRNRNRARNNP